MSWKSAFFAVIMLLWMILRLNHVKTQEVLTLRILFGSNIPPIVVPLINSTGHFTGIAGYAPELLALLSRRFSFEYTWNPVSVNLLLDDTPTKKGLLRLLSEGEGDLVIGALVATADRFKRIDFTLPVMSSAMRMLIPFPVQKSNINAFGQPFALSVWMGVLVALVTIISVWHGIAVVVARNIQRRKVKIPRKTVQAYKMCNPIEYTIKVWLCQGEALCYQSNLAVYFIAGVCCFGAFFLIQAYNCNLLPLIMAPLRKPLVESLNDIAHVPGLRVAVNRGLATDVVLQDVARENTSTSYSRDVIALQKTIFRCNMTGECLRKVSFSNHLYIHGDFALYHIINQDLERTGKCHFTLAKEALNRAYVSWGLQKSSTHTRNIFNIGLLEMHQFGLNNYLQTIYIKKPVKCLNAVDKNVRKKPLGLEELSIAFILLVIGYVLSILSLALERFTHSI